MTPFEQATATLSDLLAKQNALVRQVDDLNVKRAMLALPAQTDARAKRELADLTRERAQTIAEQENIGLAITAARKVVDAAKLAEREARDREKAEAALDLLKSFAKGGAALHKAVNTFVDAYALLEVQAGTLRDLGYAPAPTMQHLRTMCTRALESALATTPLRVRPMPPSERTSFADVIDGYVSGARRKVEVRLQQDAHAEAEVAT